MSAKNTYANTLTFRSSKDGVDNTIDFTQKMKNAVEVQKIDGNLYMNKELWLPNGGWGGFGGQVAAQSLYAAFDTVPKEFLIHSLHAYYILPCSTEVPVIYSVQKIRDGRSFATRIVKAMQNGKTAFVCSFSFTAPEKGATLNHQDNMPNVPDPDALEPDLDALDKALAANEHIPKEIKQRALNRVKDIQPIEYKSADGHTYEEIVTGNIKPNPDLRRWFKARGKLDDDLRRLHACVMLFASDSEFISVASAANGFTFKSSSIGMMATLDHVMWFHTPARADEWILYDTHSSRTSNGRGVVFGKMFTRDGTLIASTAQEASVRLTPSAQEKYQKAQEELHGELLKNVNDSKL